MADENTYTINDLSGANTARGGKRPKDEEDVQYISDSGGMQPCSACRYFSANMCQLVEGAIDPGGHCDLHQPEMVSGNMAVAELSMAITKASYDRKTGERRWMAVCSDTDPDLKQERMSIGLYQDFINRIEKNEPAPMQVASSYWKGGMPYGSISHYLDHNGYSVFGPAKAIYIDGNRLKAKGIFENELNPKVPDLTYQAIKSDIDQNKPRDDRVRISIAFIDWQHNHGPNFVFTRKSLEDECPICEQGQPVGEFLKGQLIHLAATRVPLNVRSSILTERSEAMIKTQFEDAASIVGEEEAREMEKRAAKTLIGKSVVVKSDEQDASRNEAKDVPEAGHAMATRSFGGALTISDALEWEEAEERAERVYDLWYMLTAVVDNILFAPSEVVEDKAAAMSEAIEDFKSHLSDSVLVPKSGFDDLFTRIREFSMADNATNTAPVTEVSTTTVAQPAVQPASVAHPLDNVFATLRAAYDGALNDPTLTRKQIGERVQPALNAIGAAIRRSIDAATPGEADSALGERIANVENGILAIQQMLAGQQVQPVVQQSTAVPAPRQLTPSPFGLQQPAAVPQEQPVKRSRIDEIAYRSTVGWGK